MLQGVHTGRMFTPQSKEGTIIFPGFDGGAEWGGPAVDPETGSYIQMPMKWHGYFKCLMLIQKKRKKILDRQA